jgi:AcrR family transcriptional regulator
MSPRRVYRVARPSRADRTRERIVEAVAGLLRDGRFHASSMEEVAEAAGVSRATLYQHFRSRLDVVDALCDRLSANPALLEIRETVGLPDADAALDRTLQHAVRFWASEAAMLEQLYGAAAVDPAAAGFVDRQRADRRSEIARLAARLREAGRLRAGVDERRALTVLLLLTSFETFCELRRETADEAALAGLLQELARELLVA